MNNNGEKFLDIIFRDLYDNLIVSDKEKTKEESIQRYLSRVEEMHRRASSHNKIEVIKQLYYDKYVIKKENIPDYIRGTYISDDEKEKIIAEQKKRLGEWIDYLTDDSARYPMWAKYWIFQQMLKIGTYDEMSGKYTKRTKETTKPFIEANPAAIAQCIETIQNLLGEKNKNTQQIRKIIGSLSFGKMYDEYVKKNKKNIKTNEGIWVKYNQGSEEEAKKLCNSLQGYDTPWCTASESMAISQVCGDICYPGGGDFYVYYTLDENGEYKVPRIAMRLVGHTRIGEIRGIEEHQNLEEEMLDILEAKLKEMTFLEESGVKENLKIVNDLRYLVSTIKEKTKKEIPLTPQETIDLYTKKYGFGWEQDPLVEKIIEQRRFRDDYKFLKILNTEEKVNLIITALNKNLIKLDDEFIDEKEVAMELVDRSPFNIMCVNPKTEGYQEMVLRALEILVFDNTSDVMRHIIQKNGDNKGIISEIVHEFPVAIKYVNPSVEGYKEIALEAVQRGSWLLEYIDPTVEGYKDIAIEAIRQNGMLIEHINPSVEGYREIALEAVQRMGWLLKYIDPAVEGYKEIVLVAVRNSANAIEYVSPEIEGYKEIAMEAVRQDGMALGYVNSNVEGYKEIAMEAVRRNSMALGYVNSNVDGYKEIAIEAVRNNVDAIQYVDYYFEGYKEIAMEAIKQNKSAIEKIYNQEIVEELKQLIEHNPSEESIELTSQKDDVPNFDYRINDSHEREYRGNEINSRRDFFKQKLLDLKGQLLNLKKRNQGRKR